MSDHPGPDGNTPGATAATGVSPAESAQPGAAPPARLHARGGLRDALAVLKLRDFQFLLIGNTMTFAGFQVRQMAIAWLVLEETDSSLKAGIVNAMPGIAIISASLLAGAVSDRSERWRLIFITRLFTTALLALSAVLVMTDVIKWWHFIPIGVGIGLSFAFHNPSSQTYAMDVVGRERLMNAAALNTSISNLANIAAPAVGGYLLAIGNVWAFWLLVALYGTSFLAILPIAKRTTSVPNPRGIVSDIRAGLKYVNETPAIKWLLVLGAGSIFSGVFLAMVPVFARSVFKVGESGYGQLLLVQGAGALAGSLALAGLGQVRRKGLLVLGNTIATAVATAVFAVSPSFGIALGAMFVTGVSQSITFITVPTVIQTRSTPEMRGRVMGIFFMVVLVFQLGWIFGGVLDTTIGSRETVMVGAMGSFALAVFAFAASPALRKLT